MPTKSHSLSIQSSSTLSCLAGGLRDLLAHLAFLKSWGSTAPSYHALIVGGGSGAGPPFSWRGGNGLQCFSTGQLFQPCTHLKVQPCCALHVRLYTAQAKEQDVALHQGNSNGGLKAELNLFRWQSNIWWRSASWVLLRIPPNQEILRLCLLLTCQ